MDSRPLKTLIKPYKYPFKIKKMGRRKGKEKKKKIRRDKKRKRNIRVEV